VLGLGQLHEPSLKLCERVSAKALSAHARDGFWRLPASEDRAADTEHGDQRCDRGWSRHGYRRDADRNADQHRRRQRK